MAQVNRYSRPAQVAKFNPLTAQEIMAVPLMKQEMEDQQIAENREELKALYDTKAVGLDQETVNATRSALEGRLMSLSDEISSKGISAGRTKEFRKLKADYDREMSTSGVLGHANEFVAKAEQAKNNFYTTALKDGWSKERVDYLWQQHSKNQSAFGPEGELNTEYEELGVPKFESPDEQLLSEFKNLGYELRRSAEGVDIKSNANNISHAIRALKDKYSNPSTPEGRLAQLEGWTPEYIDGLLLSAGNSMLQYDENRSYLDSMDLANAKVARKAQEELLKQNMIASENVWEFSPSLIKSAGVQENENLTNEHFNRLEEKIKLADEQGKTYEEKEALEQEYLGLKEVYRKLTEKFENSTKLGKTMKEEVEKARNINPENGESALFFDEFEALLTSRGDVGPVGSDDDFYRNSEKGLNYLSDITNNQEAGKFSIGKDKDGKPTYSLKVQVEGNDGQPKTRTVMVTKEQLDNYNKAKTTYSDALYNEIGKDKSHLEDKEYIFVGRDSVNKVTRDAAKKFDSTFSKMVKSNSPELDIFQVGMLEDGELVNLPETMGDDAEEYKEQLKNIMSDLSEKVTTVSSFGGNNIHSPGMRVQVTIPGSTTADQAKYGDLAGKTLDLMVEVNPTEKGSLGDQLMTESIKGTTNDAKLIARSNREYYDYGKFTPSQKDSNNYYNDDNIKGYLKPTSAMASFIKDEHKVDIYRDKGVYRMKRLNEGMTEDLEFKDLLEGMGDTMDEAANFLNKNSMIFRVTKEMVEANEDKYPGFKELDQQARGAFLTKTILELRNSTLPVTTKDDRTFLKLLEGNE